MDSNQEQIDYSFYNALINDDLEEYKKLFNQFMNDETYYGIHEYPNVHGGNFHLSRYPHCSCLNNSSVSLVSSLKKLNKCVSVFNCHCKNGKYYSLVNDATNYLTEQQQYESKIIKWLLSLPYPLLLNWKSIHDDCYYTQDNWYPFCEHCENVKHNSVWNEMTSQYIIK